MWHAVRVEAKAQLRTYFNERPNMAVGIVELIIKLTVSVNSTIAPLQNREDHRTLPYAPNRSISARSKTHVIVLAGMVR